MKIAIAGAGMVGSYLNHILQDTGHEIDIYDISGNNKTRCGIAPCAWGVTGRWSHLVKDIGLNPEKYIISDPKTLTMDNVKFKADLLTIDKPELIRNLLKHVTVKDSKNLNIEEYDLVIDATGVARAYLPPIDNDLIADTIQYCVHTEEPLKNQIVHIKGGYVWCFPLGMDGNEEYYLHHVGAGSLFGNDYPSYKLLEILGIKDALNVTCSCESKVRVTGLPDSIPIGWEKVLGVGESIGCVSPLMGDGIVTGMINARLLKDNIVANRSGSQYTLNVLRRFEWMKEQNKIVRQILIGKRPGLKGVLALRKDLRRMDAYLGPFKTLKLMWGLRNYDKF